MEQSDNKYLAAFVRLGLNLREAAAAIRDSNPAALKEEAMAALYDAALAAGDVNPWFTRDNTAYALESAGLMLDEHQLRSWFNKYPKLHLQNKRQPKTVLVVMAGNIPLVWFHDMICVLASGHRFAGKPSSADPFLPAAMTRLLTAIEPEFSQRIILHTQTVKKFDLVIATGSNNSARYFDYYFGKFPHIIRKGRTSAAILTGNENEEALQALGSDIFSYFGLGCRNVSQIWMPRNFDLNRLVNAWGAFRNVVSNQKYFNNYEYNKALMIVNKIPHTDSGFFLLSENPQLFSPVSVIHYQTYTDISSPVAFFNDRMDQLQCLVGRPGAIPAPIDVTPFGKAQQPRISDYADGIDTLDFLCDSAIASF